MTPHCAPYEDGRRILGEYVEAGPQDAEIIVDRLLVVLSREDLVKALDRINRRRVIRPVESSNAENLGATHDIER